MSNTHDGTSNNNKRSANGPRGSCTNQSKAQASSSSSRQPEQALKDAIHHLVERITKTFIVDSWYQVISSTNHDFVASCECLIEEVLNKLAALCTNKLDKYRTGQLVIDLLHDHIMNENSVEKHQSIEKQIDNYEYDIVQNLVVKLFGLLSNDNLQRVVFTMINDAKSSREKQYKSSSGTLETSALYTLVIALLTKSVFMPIIDIISEPKWLYAVIIYLCKKESKREQQQQPSGNINGEAQLDPRESPEVLTASTSIIVTDSRGQREDGFDVASANINFDNPISGSLKKPLDNIEIFSTEEVNSKSSSYVLYCIRFDGIYYRHPSTANPSYIPEYPDVPIIDKRQTHSVRRRANHSDAVSRTTATTTMSQPHEEAPNRRSFRRTMVIKRRFREFVLLQLRLEENPKLRPYLRNIPKPTKLKSATQNIFSLPGLNNIKLDQSTIKLRQRFLERFLLALSDSPFIVNSYEFKEFFSYNVNTTQQLSKSKSTILQVNLNKVFVDSVRSAFSIIRSTLPGDDHQSLRTSTNSDPDAWLTELQQSTLKLHVQTKSSHVKMGLEKLIDSKLSSIQGNSPIRQQKCSSLGRYYQQQRQHKHTNSPFYWMGSDRGGSLNAQMVKSASSSSNLDSTSSAMVISKSSSSYSQNADATTSVATTISTNTNTTSKTSSTESVYQDASNIILEEDEMLGSASSETKVTQTDDCNSIQICDNYPIATKFFDIIYYSISRNPSCHKPFHLMARFFLGRIVERYAAQLLSALVNLETAALCIEGITSSIWDEGDTEISLDVENATLELAVEHSCRLIEHTYASNTLIPKQLLRSLLSKQLHFYISQLGSQKRNKFVIYAFFVQLIEDIDDSSPTSATATGTS